MPGGPVISTPSHSTDLEAIHDGYVSVTPLALDLTHDAGLEALPNLRSLTLQWMQVDYPAQVVRALEARGITVHIE